MFAEAFDVELDSFSHQAPGFVEGLGGGNAAGKIRRPSAIAGVGFIEQNGVLILHGGS